MTAGFDFALPTRILFGGGTRSQAGVVAASFGQRALLVGGRDRQRLEWIIQELNTYDVDFEQVTIIGEPTVEMVREGARLAREDGRECVIGVGGGSVIDAAKAIAILATNSTEPLDYLEVVGKGQAFTEPPLPFIAIPTTAGAGAEVTRNAVITSVEHGVKASLRHPSMAAKVALVDPELTATLAPDTTAYTGLDALTQVLEPYVSARANPLIDALCVEGMRRVSTALPRAYQDGSDKNARESMSFAALLSGLCLSHAGLGVVHGFAAPLGGMLHAPHGALCAAILPHGVAVNIRALRQRAPSHASLLKFDEAARLLTGEPHATADQLEPWLADMVERLGVPGLAEHGLTRDQIPKLVQKAMNSSSMKANPIQLNTEELSEVAELSL